ncbi:MAG: hypothetical protein EYC68_10300 [Chloroflexota bacterium]|nr:MAG: hypothetical protein EYC68_10300 [Chloroflexota bacterium]
MRRRNETRQATLQLFFLENSDKDQAAWVRASTGREACISLSKTTDIPIVVLNDYGWVQFPEEHKHTNHEVRPSPYWEYQRGLYGIADLRSFPAFVRSLSESTVPRREGQVKKGREFDRLADNSFKSIVPVKVIGDAKIFHSGYRDPYSIHANQMSGFQGNLSTVESRKAAILELADGESENHAIPKMGDFVKVKMKGNEGDYIVLASVTGIALVVHVVSIEKVQIGASRQ